MEEFQAYAPEDIILDNLVELRERNAQTQEQEQAHLRELAFQITNAISEGNPDVAALLAALPEHKLPTANRTTVGDTARRARLAVELSRLISQSKETLIDTVFPIAPKRESPAAERICYQKNGYTDLAYQYFSSLLSEPRASYAHGFASVCEEVYNELSEYCILPIENSAEGRLNSFERLISEYDLKMTATCEIQTGEDRSTRFALLRRSAVRLETAVKYPLFFECACELSQDSPSPTDVLVAAQECALTVQRAEITLSNKEAGNRHLRLCLAANADKLSAFLIYLAMEVPMANLIGLYPHLTDFKKK